MVWLLAGRTRSHWAEKLLLKGVEVALRRPKTELALRRLNQLLAGRTRLPWAEKLPLKQAEVALRQTKTQLALRRLNQVKTERV